MNNENDKYKGIRQRMDLNNFFTVKYENKVAGYGWRDGEGNITDDPKKVKTKVEIFVDFPILAKDEDDFEILLQREIDLRGIGEAECRSIIKDDLQDYFSEIKQYYKGDQLRTPSEISELEILLKSFISFLDQRPKEKKEKKEEQIKYKNFEDYFTTNIRDIDGLKKMMQKAKGKELSAIITILEPLLPENMTKKYFYKSFNPNLNESGVNKYLAKNDDGHRLIETDDYAQYIQTIQNQLNEFL
ncbi:MULTISPECIES: hypothetical protein [unclassified Kaistella]|uniref:hypothetical protein n=1 Tax=unclassified Kaistella TaxID=2762626 RepID=UPI00273678D2|nr:MULTISPECIES: hypothetical protein [unclassified Kaistella]MDP2452637.1 hypothetical protein [Kaistella sp. SH11-4b]MDP2455545.1 hypothetical protein [Kaistella sp. SH40-3]MDP2458449.1 hypothetical protein [Kaistella sp. SH19-2b]